MFTRTSVLYVCSHNCYSLCAVVCSSLLLPPVMCVTVLLLTRCLNCASILQLLESEMARADRLKGEGIQGKENHDSAVKQLVQTLKVSAGPTGSADMEENASQLRDSRMAAFFSPSGSVKKGLVLWKLKP